MVFERAVARRVRVLIHMGTGTVDAGKYFAGGRILLQKGVEEPGLEHSKEGFCRIKEKGYAVMVME